MNSPIKRDQLKGIASVLTSFIAIAGSDEVRAHIRLVEDNDVPDAGGLNNLDLSHDVDKIRYIISYYNELSQPNNVKDGVLLAQRDAIRYESTGKSNLTKDVTLYFQKLITVELEMQPHVRLSPYLKIKHCAKVLTKEILALSASTSSLPLATANYPFNTFKNDVLELCNNLHILPKNLLRVFTGLRGS